MAGKTVPWWRKALNFALGGIRTGLGLLARLGKPDAAAEIAEGPAENPEEDIRLIEDFPNSLAAAAEPMAATVPAPAAEDAVAPEIVLAAEPAIPSPRPIDLVAETPELDAPILEEALDDTGALPTPEATTLPAEAVAEAEFSEDSLPTLPGSAIRSEETAVPSAEEPPAPPTASVDAPIQAEEAEPQPDVVAESAPEVQPEEIPAEQPVVAVPPVVADEPEAEPVVELERLPEALPEPVAVLPPAAAAVEAAAHEVVPDPVSDEPADDLPAEEPGVAAEEPANSPDIESEPAPEADVSEPAAEPAPMAQPAGELEAEADGIVEPEVMAFPEAAETGAEQAAEEPKSSENLSEPPAEAEDHPFLPAVYGPIEVVPDSKTWPTGSLSDTPEAPADDAEVAREVKSPPAAALRTSADSEDSDESAGFSYRLRHVAFTAANLPAAEPAADLEVETAAALEPLEAIEPPSEDLPDETILEAEIDSANIGESPAEAEAEAEAPVEAQVQAEPSAEPEVVAADAEPAAEPVADLTVETEVALEPLQAEELSLGVDESTETASEAEPGPIPESDSAQEEVPEPEADEADRSAEESEPITEAEPLPIAEIAPEKEAETVLLAAEEFTEPAAETAPETAVEPAPPAHPAVEAGAETAKEEVPIAAAVAEPVQPVEAAPPAVPAKPLIVIKSRDNEADLSPFSVIVAQVYDGPLDLLLDLIRKQDIDIYDIPIAKITAQFLAYVNQLKAGDMDVAGEFIYTASLLIHIKSKMLLPRTPTGPDDTVEDPRRELVERLLEHERFKNAAQMLQQKQMLEAATWTNPGLREFKGDAGTEPEIAADTVDLVRIFRDILERARKRPVFNVDDDQVTVGQMIQYLSRRLTMEDKPVALRRLLSHTRSERSLIAMFLALLELVRLQAILLRQDSAFSDIFIKKHSGFDAVMNQGLANPQDDWR